MSNLRENTRELPQLQVGDKVFVQNQVGDTPTKWDLTGTVKEVRQFDQYVIKLDHSGNETLRNRKYLRLWNIPENSMSLLLDFFICNIKKIQAKIYITVIKCLYKFI